VKLEVSEQGKPYYVIEVPEDGLKCLDVISEFVYWDSAYNSDFAAALNGLKRFFRKKEDSDG